MTVYRGRARRWIGMLSVHLAWALRVTVRKPADWTWADVWDVWRTSYRWMRHPERW